MYKDKTGFPQGKRAIKTVEGKKKSKQRQMSYIVGVGPIITEQK